MGEKIKCLYCKSIRVRELITIVGIDTGPPDGRIPELDEEFRVFRCLKCGRQFSEKEVTEKSPPDSS
jgi:hypothetical protein